MLSPDGYVSPRKIEGVAVQVLYDRSYAVYKIATSLVEPLMIGGYTSQELRDVLVGLVEDAIVQKRPTIRFESGKAVHLEEFYAQHSSTPAHSEVALDNLVGDGVNDAVGLPSDVAADLVGNDADDAVNDALTADNATIEALDNTDPLDDLRPGTLDILRESGIDPRENLLETGGAAPKATTSRKGAKK